MTPDELFEVARLVVAAEIAKIHTIEWTPQLLYDEPLLPRHERELGGLLDRRRRSVGRARKHRRAATSARPTKRVGRRQWYSVFASGPGIFGLGNHVYPDASAAMRRTPDIWSLANPTHVNGGANHFGSPFNFPEEFVTVYRLHPLVPDLIEYRDWNHDPNMIRRKIPVVETVARRSDARDARARPGELGAVAWAASALGALALQNHPQFLQNLPMPRLPSADGQDRRRGARHHPRPRAWRSALQRVPPAVRSAAADELRRFHRSRACRPARPNGSNRNAAPRRLRDVYGQHRCDASKIITDAQLDDDGKPINDCLGHPDGAQVDNIEDLDTVVGWLAESRRPHGSRSRRRSSRCSSSTRRAACSATVSSRPASAPSSTPRSASDWVTNNGSDGQHNGARHAERARDGGVAA